MAAIKDPLDAPNLQVWISSDTYRNVANGTALPEIHTTPYRRLPKDFDTPSSDPTIESLIQPSTGQKHFYTNGINEYWRTNVLDPDWNGWEEDWLNTVFHAEEFTMLGVFGQHTGWADFRSFCGDYNSTDDEGWQLYSNAAQELIFGWGDGAVASGHTIRTGLALNTYYAMMVSRRASDGVFQVGCSHLASSAIQASAATYLPPQADTDAMYIFNDRNSNDHTTGLMTCRNSNDHTTGLMTCWCWWTMDSVSPTLTCGTGSRSGPRLSTV